MTAQYFEHSPVSKDDMERIRALVLHALKMRYVAECPTTTRNEQGVRWVTGQTPGALALSIDFRAAWKALNEVRRGRLLGWALGVSPYDLMGDGDKQMLREDLLKIRRFAQKGGYGHLIGLDSRLGL